MSRSVPEEPEPSGADVAFGALTALAAASPDDLDGVVDSLFDQLSSDERLAMMSGDLEFWPGMVAMLSGGYGHTPYVGGAIERLGYPGIRFCDGPRGVTLGASTCFPVSMARGATWDVWLEERVGMVIGGEARVQGANLIGSVCVNLLYHPAGGRAQETYGEDPCHVGALGAAAVRGLQRHVIACVKHFALNNMENARFQVDVHAEPRVLHEVYLRHFKQCIDAGAGCVMSAYNSVNGHWCGQSRTLLAEILKQDWGFDGFVVTDWIFGIRDAEEAANAGLDIEMPFRMHYACDLGSWSRAASPGPRSTPPPGGFSAPSCAPPPRPSRRATATSSPVGRTAPSPARSRSARWCCCATSPSAARPCSPSPRTSDAWPSSAPWPTAWTPATPARARSGRPT